MHVRKLLDKSVGFQPNVWSPISGNVNVINVIQDIKNGKYKSEINQLRQFLIAGNDEQYQINKMKLSGVTFSASFRGKKRSRDAILSYSELLVIDIDKLGLEEVDRVRQILLKAEHVASFWNSPSNLGVKGLIPLDFSLVTDQFDANLLHKAAFARLVKHFYEMHSITLDKSGGDVTRLCFCSYDPELVLKKEAKKFQIDNEDFEAEIGNVQERSVQKVKTMLRKGFLNPEGRNKAHDRSRIQSIIKFLSKRNLSITRKYPQWYKVAYAISSTFTYDIGAKYYLRLCRLDQERYDEISSMNMLRYCYENNKGQITFSTVVYLAKQQGYKEI